MLLNVSLTSSWLDDVRFSHLLTSVASVANTFKLFILNFLLYISVKIKIIKSLKIELGKPAGALIKILLQT